MSLLPVPSETCCAGPSVVNIPGPTGPAGAACVPCVDGKNAYTALTASFIMPAEGDAVTVAVEDSTWFVPDQGAIPGEIVIVEFAGYFRVVSKPDDLHVVLENVGDVANGLYLGNAAAGTVIPSGAGVSAAGLQGPTGTTPAGALLAANNLADIANAALSRASLGILDAALHTDSEYMDSVGAAVVDNRVTRFDGTSGKVVQQSPMAITDAGELQISTGNAKGANAVDLQTQRAVATQVASGAKSAVGGGENNTASGADSVVPGGKGNTASGQSAVAEGDGCLAAGPYSRAAGKDAAAYVYGQDSYASGKFASVGDCPRFNVSFRGTTTDATPTEIFLDGVSERLVIGLAGSWTFDILVVGRRDNGDTASWIFQGGIKNIAGIVSMVGITPVGGLIVGGADAGCSGTWGQDANVVVDANNAEDALRIKVTGAAANNIRWHAWARVAGLEY